MHKITLTGILKPFYMTIERSAHFTYPLHHSTMLHYVVVPWGSDWHTWWTLIQKVTEGLQQQDLEGLQRNWPDPQHRKGPSWSERGSNDQSRII